MRLQLKLSLWLISIVILLGVLSAYAILVFQRRASIKQFEGMATALSVVIENALETSMAHDNPEEVKEILEHIKREPMIHNIGDIIHDIAVYSATGKVWSSTERAKIGTESDEVREVLRSAAPFIGKDWEAGKKEFRVLTPILSKPGCQGCHGSQRRTLGAVEVRLGTNILEENLRQNARIMLLVGSLTLLLILGMLGYLLRRVILDRLSNMTKSVQKISLGDYTEAIEDRRADELGFLACAFNDMRERINGYTRDLNEKIGELTLRLTNLNIFGETLSSAEDFTQVLTRLVETTKDLLFADTCSVYLVEENGKTLTLQSASGPGSGLEREVEIGEGFIGRVAKERKPISTYSPKVHPVSGAKEDSLNSVLAVPLVSKDRLIGVIEALRSLPRPFSEGDLSLLSTIASQVALAIDNHRLFKELKARKDLLGRLFERVISAQEEERKRIARELHDETGQALNALIIHLNSAEEALPVDLTEARKKLGELRSLTAHTLDEIHRLIYDLRPTLLDDLGLIPAIRWYTKSHLEPLDIKVHLEIIGLEKRLAPRIETALFRIVQEALTNIVKHANAKRVTVRLELKESVVITLIEDDGRGFDAAVPEGSPTLGLVGIKERVALLGGVFRIHSKPGKGTQLVIEIPLEAGGL